MSDSTEEKIQNEVPLEEGDQESFLTSSSKLPSMTIERLDTPYDEAEDKVSVPLPLAPPVPLQCRLLPINTAAPPVVVSPALKMSSQQRLSRAQSMLQRAHGKVLEAKASQPPITTKPAPRLNSRALPPNSRARTAPPRRGAVRLANNVIVRPVNPMPTKVKEEPEEEKEPTPTETPTPVQVARQVPPTARRNTGLTTRAQQQQHRAMVRQTARSAAIAAAQEEHIEPVPLVARPPANLKQARASVFQKLNGALGSCAVTSFGRTDGVGAQALGKITVRVMAHALGMKYAHAPFRVLEHTDNNMKAMDYLEHWETLLDIGGSQSDSVLIYPHTKNLECKQLERTITTHPFQPGWLFNYRDAHAFTDGLRTELEDSWKDVLSDLRMRYQKQHSASGSFDRTNDPMDKPVKHVAVHIRRGDALQRNAQKRMLSTDYFAAVMDQLRTSEPDTHFVFHVVSEGSPEDFEDLTHRFPDAVVQLHLSEPSINIYHSVGRPRTVATQRNHQLMNRRTAAPQQEKLGAHRPGKRLLDDEDPEEEQAQSSSTSSLSTEDAFKLLVGADVLIMSKSAFSFLAALYSSAELKIFPPDFWYTIPLWCEKHDGWVPNLQTRN